MLMKIGVSHQASHPGLMAYVTSVPLIVGYSLYGINTVLMIFALRDGELSVLWPIIALTYVWVTMLSATFFRESLNFSKVFGVSLVVIGVAVLGRGRES